MCLSSSVLIPRTNDRPAIPMDWMSGAGADNVFDSVQVNIPAESGEMGILAGHVPSIEQLKPGLIEVIEESSGSKQFFRTFLLTPVDWSCVVFEVTGIFVYPWHSTNFGNQQQLQHSNHEALHELTKTSHSVWRLRDSTARLPSQHQRRRGLPS